MLIFLFSVDKEIILNVNNFLFLFENGIYDGSNNNLSNNNLQLYDSYLKSISIIRINWIQVKMKVLHLEMNLTSGNQLKWTKESISFK